MLNKYPATCHYCKATIPASGGQIWRWKGRWYGAHLECKATRSPRVHSYTFSSGETATQNVNGRCEDAPCCGCCTC